ncbi:CBL-interacting protein kinase 4 [Halotydeus destructor]|nr:CBL-interacting protein kinase 4 [Halotydeus destructor]
MNLQCIPELPRPLIKRGKCIASGGFGFVYEAKAAPFGGAELVVKELSYEDGLMEHRIYETLLKKPYSGLLLPLFYSRSLIHGYLLGFPRAKGDLLSLRVLSQSECVLLWFQVSSALYWLHTQNNAVHMDIKPENLLVFSDGTVVVTDFGLARRMDSRGEVGNLVEVGITEGYEHPTISLCKSREGEFYMRPDSRVDGGADYWSLMVTVWEMATEHKPYPPINTAVAWSQAFRSNTFNLRGYTKVTNQFHQWVRNFFRANACNYVDNIWNQRELPLTLLGPEYEPHKTKIIYGTYPALKERFTPIPSTPIEIIQVDVVEQMTEEEVEQYYVNEQDEEQPMDDTEAQDIHWGEDGVVLNARDTLEALNFF